MQVCTIVARNYLAPARVLAQSLVASNPDARLSVVVIDAIDGTDDYSREPFEFISPFDIGIEADEYLRMATMYEVMELATAIKPWILRTLLDRGAETATYLDPDIVVLGSLEEANCLGREHGIVLTPHITQPMPRDGLLPDEEIIMLSGTYNLGFVTVGKKAADFLDWWSEHLTRWAIVEPAAGLFTDQRWIDFVPSLFEHVVVRDPSYNVAYWNLYERPIGFDGRSYTARGAPIRFFHYSGYDLAAPHLLSKHQGPRPRALLSASSPLRWLLDDARTRLIAAGHEVTSKEPYRLGVSAEGLALNRHVRRMYRDAVLESEKNGLPPPANAFDPDGGFFDWLNEPVIGPIDAKVSRYLHYCYSTRPDVMHAFPDLNGDSAAHFLTWTRNDPDFGARTPPGLIPDETTSPRLAPFPSAPGINVIGYFDAELGVGEAGRSIASSIEASGIPMSTFTFRATTSRQQHDFGSKGPSDCPFSINVLCVNADQTPRLAQSVGSQFMRNRHNIGIWFWEAPTLPVELHHSLDLVDELWAPSEFVYEALAPVANKPLRVFPLPVTKPGKPTALRRADVSLPEGFVFLFMFDYLSVIDRKNPLGLIDAYQAAFKPSDGAHLVIKTINSHQRMWDHEKLLYALEDRPDVHVLSDYLTGTQVQAMTQLSDCYVSLHRSEGFGLTLAHAMAWGKPTIATAYSGNMSFMTQATSYLVPYKLVEIGSGSPPYPPEALWADPDLSAAARKMRYVFDHPEEAADVGRAAAEHIAATRSLATAAEFVRDRFSDIETGLRR
jgi:glycosyltransferase involved in cell wall biosynthesis